MTDKEVVYKLNKMIEELDNCDYRRGYIDCLHDICHENNISHARTEFGRLLIHGMKGGNNDR